MRRWRRRASLRLTLGFRTGEGREGDFGGLEGQRRGWRDEAVFKFGSLGTWEGAPPSAEQRKISLAWTGAPHGHTGAMIGPRELAVAAPAGWDTELHCQMRRGMGKAWVVIDLLGMLFFFSLHSSRFIA